MESFEISALLAAPPRRIYSAWLNSQELSACTGSQATVDPSLDGWITVSNGYLQGHLLALRPFSEIVQTWRPADAPCCHADALMTLFFEPVDSCATRLTMQHVQIPEGMADRYRRMWLDGCLEPMRRYFAEG